MQPFKNMEEYQKWKAEKQMAQQSPSGGSLGVPRENVQTRPQSESYVRRNLRPGERIILEARITRFQVWGMTVLVGLILPTVAIIYSLANDPDSLGADFRIAILADFLFVPLAFFCARLTYKRTELAVTDMRVVEKSGVFSDNSVETPLDRIQNVVYNQSILGKTFGYGTVVIQSAARFGAEGIKGVENPQMVRDAILQQVELYRQKLIKEQAEAIATSMLGKK